MYEVAHRISDGFDDVPDERREIRTPRAFITGDACQAHCTKAGQGMNVSIHDGFNLGWKLAVVLEDRALASLLSTYAEERKVIAQNFKTPESDRHLCRSIRGPAVKTLQLFFLQPL